MRQSNPTGLRFRNAEQCEQFQMMAFGISCATCVRSDRECPWGRQEEPRVIVKPLTRRVIQVAKSGARQLVH